MLNLNHDTDPFHPLEIVAFACVGFVLSVMLALLIGQKVFHDDIGFAPAWVEMFTPQAQKQAQNETPVQVPTQAAPAKPVR